MFISFLIGYAIVCAIGAILDICIEISSYYNAKKEIREKAQETIGSDKDIFSMYIAQQVKHVDKEELVVKAYDRKKNHIANITVTAANGTPLRVGQRF